jgi:hypothetical protein
MLTFYLLQYRYLSTSMDPATGPLDATAAAAAAGDGTAGSASGAPSGATSTVEPVKKSYLDKLSERLSVVPRCYSDVPVCTFCAQFFQDQDEYRPSYDKIVRSEKKTEYLATMARDKEYVFYYTIVFFLPFLVCETMSLSFILLDTT